MRRTEKIAWGALLVAALVVRLIDLGDRAYHHDESQIAYFSWLFAERGDYEYNPLLHAPLQYYASALTFLTLGDSDFTARLPAVAMGMIVVALPLLLRRFIGTIGAFVVAALLAFGPSFLYYSRFIREDIFLAAANLGLLVALSYFLSAPRRWHPSLIGVGLALAFGIKEATFITVGIAGTFFAGWLALVWRTARQRALPLRSHPLVQAVTRVGGEAWIWGLASFTIVYLLIFTTFMTDPDHWDALYEGLKYWYEQHGPGRGEKEPYFYSVVLVAHEWPMLALGLVGAVAAIRRRWPLGIFLVWMFVVQLAAYSYANERFSWLVLHPLLPLVVLAGIGVQTIWDARRGAARTAGLALAVIGFAYTGYASFLANAEHGTDPREFLVTTQSGPDVVDVRDEVVATAARIRREERRDATITVDGADGATFPYAWYFRRLPGVGYLNLTDVDDVPDSDILILTEGNKLRLEDRLGAYRARRFGFRVWWVRDYSKMTPATFAEWLVTREPWSVTGGYPEWLLIRRR